MDKIKTPVTYTIYDPDRFKFAVYKDANGVLSPEQIAAALNTATDQSRVIEELTAERDALRREVEVVRSIAQTVISYASPMLIQMHGMSQRFDEETQRHLLDTVMQIRRSHRDLLAINKALEGESR